MALPARAEIAPHDLVARPVALFDRQWLLLTAGEFKPGAYNPMTVSWGALGMMWGHPAAWAVVRPTRHTFGLLERGAGFTLAAFPAERRAALELCGRVSGRDGDKGVRAGLTAIPSRSVAAPAWAEAELILECRILAAQDIDPAGFRDPAIIGNYPARDFHRLYIAAIERAEGVASYRAG